MNDNIINQEKITEVINRIVLGFNPDKIILFGSYATGKPTENSDLDFLIIKNSELTRPERAKELRKLLYGMKVPMDLLVYTPSEIEESINTKYSFVNEVFKTGKTVYERN
ncbi:MAG: hypothetical protein A2X61_02410 [Ignavibacteria bacterium GWB2_35_12]|nr:MAG: hypothetical protein A2X63_03590 [Ignavibacteria bacterium GWA2_35_8]OGU42434.1 MAG: hypothetical protein A2X61_02410 [Ignavibacteria bacterium GWB2_35_12]OGU96603.1 MAG: hypothetical protein A2220_11995 [Ignavibacteria bacterium RIFOXYA2_FULL_35_10]OGV24214.1 MAG: hypothetical protein A2475_08340 [Ignavibacteria bacterium RIFOXYC2_FULL_35_21]